MACVANHGKMWDMSPGLATSGRGAQVDQAFQRRQNEKEHGGNRTCNIMTSKMHWFAVNFFGSQEA